MSRFVKLATAFVLATGVMTGCTKPEPQLSKDTFILVKSPEFVDLSLKTAVDLKAGQQGFKASKVALVYCGAAVGELRQDGNQADIVEDTMNQGVEVVACEIGLRKVGMQKEDLVHGIRVVANGIIESLRLQSEGYHGVDL